MYPSPVMPESGYSNMTINAGEVENTGIELELTWKDHIGDFRYSVSGNIATLKNKVTYLDPSIERIQGATVEGASPEVVRCYFEKGEPVWYMRGFKYAGRAENGTALYYKKDGTTTNDPQAEDMTNVGSGLPDMTYGITLNAEYKGFDLTVFGAGQAGNDVYYGLYRSRYHNVAEGSGSRVAVGSTSYVGVLPSSAMTRCSIIFLSSGMSTGHPVVPSRISSIIRFIIRSLPQVSNSNSLLARTNIGHSHSL